jgi:hypothetical protein
MIRAYAKPDRMDHDRCLCRDLIYHIIRFLAGIRLPVRNDDNMIFTIAELTFACFATALKPANSIMKRRAVAGLDRIDLGKILSRFFVPSGNFPYTIFVENEKSQICLCGTDPDKFGECFLRLPISWAFGM